MKWPLIILLLGCIAIATCDVTCKWSGCEGKLRRGGVICSEYGTGLYSGNTDPSDCSWDSEKVQCCTQTPSRDGCKWTNTVYGTAYGGDWACNREFGSGYREENAWNGAFAKRRYECCPH